MNYYSLSALIIGAVSTLCGLMVFLNSPKNPRNRIFLFYMCAVALWAYTYCIWQLSANSQVALSFIHVVLISSVPLPILNYHLYIRLFNIKNTLLINILKFGYGITIFIFLLTLYRPLFITGVEQKLGFYHWPNAGPLFIFYPTLFISYFSLSFFLVFKEIKKIKN